MREVCQTNGPGTRGNPDIFGISPGLRGDALIRASLQSSVFRSVENGAPHPEECLAKTNAILPNTRTPFLKLHPFPHPNPLLPGRRRRTRFFPAMKSWEKTL